MLLQGSYLFMKVCIFPLTVASLVRAGDSDHVCSSSNNRMDFFPSQKFEEERKPRLSASSVS